MEYWQQLVSVPAREAQGFQWLSGDCALAREVHREAASTFATNPPAPLAACFQDWTVDPFGGAWHLWAQHVDGLTRADRVMKAVDGSGLYICGEAYSPCVQEWAEGAVERAETMLQRHFGLRKPEWL